MKLNKIERKYISTSVLYGWQILYYPEINQHIGWWDGDKILPVVIGPVCDRLIRKGILESVEIHWIRGTKLSKTFKCHGCHNGKLFSVNDDGNTTELGKCIKCDGIGVLEESTLTTGK